MSDLPGYDAWKTRAPGDGPFDEIEEPAECRCAHPEPVLVDHGLSSMCEKCGQRIL